MVRSHRARRATGGFTLIEVLIVMGIIAILASFTLGVAAHIRKSEFEASSRAEFLCIVTALTEYHSEQGVFPAAGHPDDEDPNLDGRLYRALFRRDVNPQGTLTTWDPSQLGVPSGDGYRTASLSDQQDPQSRVVFLDQHGRPLHYREREAHATVSSRVLQFELWCEGMNLTDDGGTGDDLVEKR